MRAGRTKCRKRKEDKYGDGWKDEGKGRSVVKGKARSTEDDSNKYTSILLQSCPKSLFIRYALEVAFIKQKINC